MLFIRYLVVVALACMLAACATNQQVVGGRLALPETIKANEGIVVVKLIGVQPLSVFNAKWQSVKFTNKQTGLVETVGDTAPPMASYSLFAGTLPPGQYEVTAFDSSGSAPGTFGVIPALVLLALTSDNQTLKDQLGTFTVRAGTLSNLGTIVTALPETKDESIKVAVLADEKGQAAALADMDAAGKTRVGQLPKSSWDKMPDVGSSERAMHIVRTHARNISTMDVTANKQLVVGSALGTLHLRSPDGSWSTMSTGSLDTIVYVRALPNGQLFAGTDNGKYYLWQPSQSAWIAQHIPDADAKVMLLEPMGATGYAIVTGQMAPFGKVPKIRIYAKANLADAGGFTELMHLEAYGLQPTFFNGKELQVYQNIPGFARSAEEYRIHPVTLKKSMQTVDYFALGVYRLPGDVLVLNRMNSMSYYNDFSDGTGSSWRRNEVAAPYTTRFIDQNTGYGLVNIATGWSSITVSLNKTTDGGKTWSRIGTPIEGVSTMPAIRFIDHQVFIFTGQKLISTTDDGATWKTEWPLARK